MRLGLEHTRAFLDHLGRPQLSLGRVVHLAGTNGKGSTAATLEALLRRRGLRVGKYTSPHLIDFRERIVVDGDSIPATRVTAFIAHELPAIERMDITFFEATTALALLYFAEMQVDAAVIETGLGGRLDSTNVIVPDVAVVTSIGIDHVEYLGSTLESIAGEKAGIFKAGAAAAIGDANPSIASLLSDRALAAGSTPVVTLLDRGWPSDIVVSGEGTSFTLRDASGVDRRWRTPLVGRHQAANAAVALLAHDLLGPDTALTADACQEALDGVRLTGRFERRGEFIFDVAHNPAGSGVLAATLAHVQPARPVVTVLAVLSDKDWRGMMEQLAPHTDLFVLTMAPSAPANRLWDPQAAHAYAAAAGWASVVEPDLGIALERARHHGATVVVTGSFHTVGDALARLPAASRAG